MSEEFQVALQRRDTAAQTGGQSRAPLAPYTWYVVALITLINALNYLDRVALSVMAPHLKRDLALSDGQLGLLIGFAFFLVYATCGIPIARWADRGNRKIVIVISMVIWSSMTAVTGAASNFWQLVLARMGLGIGEAGVQPAVSSLLTDYVPFNRRPAVFAITGLGSIAGTSLGLFVAGSFTDSFGWRLTFVLLGLPGLVVAALVHVSLREPRSSLAGKPSPSVSPNNSWAELWGNLTYRRVVMFMVINGFITAAFQQWLSSFYVRSYGLSLSEVGAKLGIALAIGSAGGLLLGGLLTNRLLRRSSSQAVLMCVLALMASGPAALGVIFAPTAQLSIVMVGITGALWSAPSGLVTSTLYSSTSSSVRATGGAVAVFAIGVFGFGLGPSVVGFLSDALAPRYGEDSLKAAMLMPLLLYPIYIFLMHRIGRDLNALHSAK